jgi:hypothetical protein
MKLFATFAMTAATIFVASQFAAAAECKRPARLDIPNGATASDEAMKATQAKFPPYAREVQTYLQCLAAEIKAGTDEYKEVSEEWAKQSKIFQSTPAKQ